MDRSDTRRLRVLAVDDNRDAADSLRVLAELWGHEARAAYDGPAALAAATDFGPDVCLLDLGLPRLDGFELARRLRAAHPDPGPALVAVTGYAHQAVRERAAAAGFDHVLVKPVDPTTLRDLLGNLGHAAALAREARDLAAENADLVRQMAEQAERLRRTIQSFRDLRS